MKTRWLLRASIFLSVLSISLPAMSWQAHRRAKARRKIEVRMIDQQVNVANQSSYSFTVNLPPPNESRILLIAVYGYKNATLGTLNSMTVNGLPTTYFYGMGLPMYFHTLKDSSLSGNQTFTANFSVTEDRAGIAVFEVYGWGGWGTDSQFMNTPAASKTYNFNSVEEGSVIVALAYNVNPNSINWTSAVPFFNVTLESSDQASVAVLNVSAGGNYSINVSSSGGAYSIACKLTSRPP